MSNHALQVLCCTAMSLTLICVSAAAELDITVIDRKGEAIADVAVYVVPKGDMPARSNSSSIPVATIEQIDTQFVPHMLVVQTGTDIEFPNNDTVSHHVYSFSEAKPFQLDLYKGNAHPPQRFDRPGLVVLGCNIHDSMLAYVLVVDTPWYGLTNEYGATALSGLPGGEYDLYVWTPRADPEDLPAAQDVSIDANGNTQLSVTLTARLRPPHAGSQNALSWDSY